MSEEELSAINPTYIVLDEFHRCGAEMWGEGVQRLLRIFSNARILGLSATAIRYLDNQRDMVAELFDGNVASEITLGEAIVKGILNPPKYVLSIFSCQKDLEKYEARVRRTKAKVVRDAATVYLDALRRTLEKAEGLEEIFYKHMTEKNGKYRNYGRSPAIGNHGGVEHSDSQSRNHKHTDRKRKRAEPRKTATQQRDHKSL